MDYVGPALGALLFVAVMSLVAECGVVGAVFMRVDAKCAHQVRPPLARRQPRASFCRINLGVLARK